MFKTIHSTITIVANDQVLDEVITGARGVTRRIVEIWFEQIADEVLVGFVDQHQLVDVPSEVAQADYKAVPVDYTLEDGETFSVGIKDEGGGGTDTEIVTVIEETSGL